ncbi:MAG: GNAT family N-acetyltransferase [Chloroflexales bacterium]|nr:GNAT family N-acetyltransferase [Chloroflexales bacterium]
MLRSALWGASIGRMAITDFRVHIRRLQGEDWSVVYLGADFSFEEIQHILFPNKPQIQSLGRVFLWRIPALVRQFAQQGLLTICELDKLITWQPKMTYSFVTPAWLQQVLDVARPVDAIEADMSQNMRRNLRKARKNEFSYIFTQNPADIRMFYYQMYLPYQKERYGARAVLSSYEEICRTFAQGGLILVKRGEQPICGMMCHAVGDTCKSGPMGVHVDHFDQVGQGCNVALWWFMGDWARQQNLRYFDFGSSRPYTADGVFHFKRQWGTRVKAQPDALSKWVFGAERLPESLRQHLNTQGLIAEIDNQHYQVILLGPNDSSTTIEYDSKLQHALNCGLSGLWIAHPARNMRLRG